MIDPALPPEWYSKRGIDALGIEADVLNLDEESAETKVAIGMELATLVTSRQWKIVRALADNQCLWLGCATFGAASTEEEQVKHLYSQAQAEILRYFVASIEDIVEFATTQEDSEEKHDE